MQGKAEFEMKGDRYTFTARCYNLLHIPSLATYARNGFFL